MGKGLQMVSAADEDKARAEAEAARAAKPRDLRYLETRELLGVSLAMVARWGGVTKRAVERFELDQGGDHAARLLVVYGALGNLRAAVNSARGGA